jgi:hypothetical protein
MVKPEDRKLRGFGFIPHTEETIFRAPFIWTEAWTKRENGGMFQPTFALLHVRYGRVDFEDLLNSALLLRRN